MQNFSSTKNEKRGKECFKISGVWSYSYQHLRIFYYYLLGHESCNHQKNWEKKMNCALLLPYMGHLLNSCSTCERDYFNPHNKPTG